MGALHCSGRFVWLLVCLLAPAGGVWADLLVVANEHAGMLSILDPKAGRAIATLQAGGDPHNLAVTTDGQRVVVTHPSAGWVTLVDPRQAAILRRLEVPGGPHGVAVSPDDRWVVVGAERARKIHVLDLQRMELERVFDIEPPPHNLVATQAGQAWITAQGGEFLWLVDPRDGKLLSRLKTSARPHDLALTR